jgi:uncharacterized membrane protein
MATRKPGAAARPGTGGAKSRDKGTRGGRPEASATIGQQGNRPARPGNGRSGNGQARAAGQAQRGRTAVAVPAAAGTATAGTATAGPPPWLQWTTWILSLAGLADSIWLTIVHYNTSVTLICPANSTINCEKVITSPQSIVFGIPVAVLGLAFYVFLAVANSPWVWRMPWPPIRYARVGSMVVGILFVLYLVYTELFTIRAICLWCTSVHVITFALFVLIVFSAAAGYGVQKAPATQA